jgi:hypothetical protein
MLFLVFILLALNIGFSRGALDSVVNFTISFGCEGQTRILLAQRAIFATPSQCLVSTFLGNVNLAPTELLQNVEVVLATRESFQIDSYFPSALDLCVTDHHSPLL